MNIFDAIIACGAQERLDIAKAMDSEIEKAEGSRGGKIIGHTKSGKPIYDSANHAAHADFTSDEHKEAAATHLSKNYSRKKPDAEKEAHHEKQRAEHMKLADNDKSPNHPDKQVEKIYDKLTESEKFKVWSSIFRPGAGSSINGLIELSKKSFSDLNNNKAFLSKLKTHFKDQIK